jgi:nucleotide-binding universal stress UspA family protein
LIASGTGDSSDRDLEGRHQRQDELCFAARRREAPFHDGSIGRNRVARAITDWPSLESERALQEEARDAAHAKIASIQAAARVHAPLRVAVGNIVATVTENAREDDADLILIGRGALQSALGRLRTHAYGIIQREELMRILPPK